jgi:methionyl aminopeptidase
MRRLLTLRRGRKLPVYHSEEERIGLRAAGRFNARLFDFLRPYVREGVATGRLDRLAEEYTRDHGYIPACLGYNGFPSSICASVNEVVCHGIPNNYRLRSGDIVNIDCTTIVDGWYGDSSETFLIGKVNAVARKLVQVAFDSLFVGIQAAQPFVRLYEIGKAVERFAKIRGFEVVREYQGHGIGREFHQDPGVPHHYQRIGAPQELIEPGMCFTIEPMINAGTWRTFLDTRDNWTVRTLDLALSAQFEHTVLMTEVGPEVLTLTQTGPQMGHKF